MKRKEILILLLLSLLVIPFAVFMALQGQDNRTKAQTVEPFLIEPR